MTTRRHFLQQTSLLATLPILGSQADIAAGGAPQSVTELWADFDPRKDALETEVIRE